MGLKKIITIAGVAIVVLGGGVAGTMFALGLFSHEGKLAGKPVNAPPKPILFAELTDVVVSVPDDVGDPPSSFVQFAVQFATTDPNAVTSFTSVQPIIKSDIIGLLMNETGKALEDPATRATLAKNCLDISNNVVIHSANYASPAPFTAAYITNLVVQD